MVAPTPSWSSQEIDTSRASVARVYDYLLDGGHNFAVDRELAQRGLEMLPSLRDAARFNRAFMRRAVLHCVRQGIDQFLDLGSGVPTVGNVHEIATDARVVYVDNEAVAVSHSKLILRDIDRADVVQTDIRDPRSVLNHPVTRRMIDFDRPVAVLMVALLHSVSDEDDPPGIVAQFREVMAPGSFLALSHGTPDRGSDLLLEYFDLYRDTANPLYLRGYRDVVALFDGFELLDPGVVFTPQWRPDWPEDVPDDPERGFCYAGVGRKR